MTRYMVLKYIMKCLNDNDIAIFTGAGLCREAFNFDRPGNFYIDDAFGFSVPFAIGLSLGTDKRVFVFCGEGDLIRNLGAAMQMAISKKKNIILVILNNNMYQDVGDHPNIFCNLKHKHGMFFDMGFLSFNLTSYFVDSYHAKNIKELMLRLSGPVSIFIDVEKSKTFPELTISKMDLTDRFKKFVQDRSLGTSLLEPPKLDMDLLGGITNGV